MKTRTKGPKIVISGYYGFDNCGDEAVLLSIIHCLRQLAPEARITVLSGSPDKTRESYGVKAANRWNPVIIAKELATCRLLISGGGSLIQDVTSARSPGYYLGVIRMALFLRKKVMIYGQGVGPLTIEKNRAGTGSVFSRCHAIALRDAASAELLRELGVRQNILVACDPVMALSCDDVDPGKWKEESGKQKVEKPLLLAVIRCWKDNGHIAPVAELLDTQISKGWDVLLVPAHFPADMEAIAMLRGAMKTQPQSIDKCLTAREFLSLIASADRVFSMRLHGLICAMALGVPMLGLSYDPKVGAFMEQAGAEEYCLSFDGFDLSAAIRMMGELDSLLPERVKEREARQTEMRHLAWEMAKAAELLINY